MTNSRLQAPAKLSSWGRVNDDGTGGPVVDALMTKGPMGMGVDATCFQGCEHHWHWNPRPEAKPLVAWYTWLGACSWGRAGVRALG